MFISSNGFAQKEEYVEVRDFESWSSVGLDYKLSKKWSFGLQEQLRLDNNSSGLKGFFTQLSTRYYFVKNFALGAGLRYTTKNDNEGKVQGYRNYFRYQVDAKYKHEVNRLSFNYRLRYQNRNELGVTIENGDYPIEYVRLKAEVEYNIKGWKLDPIVSGEVFNLIEKGVDQGIDAYRISLGTDFKVHKKGKLAVSYRVETSVNTEYPKTNYILRLKYTYTIKNKSS